MSTCKRCSKPTSIFPLNKLGKPSTMCQKCYDNTVERNARKHEAAKLERANLPPGMGFCMACKKSKPESEFEVSSFQRRKIARGETIAKNCASCRERLARQVTERRREEHKDPAKKAAFLIEKRDYQRRCRDLLIEAYGGHCKCCGEDEPKFLELHHIEGGGGKHRKQIGNGTEAIYRWCAQNGFPKTMELICANCHNAVSFWGYCPHQKMTPLAMMDECQSIKSLTGTAVPN